MHCSSTSLMQMGQEQLQSHLAAPRGCLVCELPAVGAKLTQISLTGRAAGCPRAAQPGSVAAPVQGAPCHCLASVPPLELLFCAARLCPVPWETAGNDGRSGSPQMYPVHLGHPFYSPQAAPETLPNQTRGHSEPSLHSQRHWTLFSC